MRRAAVACGAVLLAVMAAAAAAQPGPGSGAGSAEAADPDAGSAGSGSGSAGSGSGSAGSGSGSAGSGSGAGAPRIIQLPTDIAAPQVSAAASPTEVSLGGKFTVFITATFGDGVEVNLREPIELGSVFEVTRKVTEDRRAPDGRKTREWQLEVIAWELGDLVMPPISVTYTAFGRAGQVQTNAIKLKVTGVLGDVVDDPKAIRDHAPPKDLLSRDWFWVWVAAAAGALIGLVTGLLVWRRRRRRLEVRLVAGAVAAPRRMDGPSARALEKLLAIEKSGVLDRDEDRKAGYTEMVEVMREYISARYRVDLVDLTTRELLRALERAAPADARALVETWLERCDIVKYGGLRATRDDARTTLDDARAVVVTTTDAPAGAPAGAGGAKEAA
jgi:hypothetical protein